MQCIENFKDLLDLFQLRPQFKRNAIRFEINCKKKINCKNMQISVVTDCQL